MDESQRALRILIAGGVHEPSQRCPQQLPKQGLHASICMLSSPCPCISCMACLRDPQQQLGASAASHELRLRALQAWLGL